MQREADIFSFARCGSPCGYISAYSFIVLLHEFVHANDIQSGYFTQFEDKNSEELIEIGEVRAMIVENMYRKEVGIKEIRTEYNGIKLLADDGITPIKDYGIDITKDLIPEETEEADEKSE